MLNSFTKPKIALLTPNQAKCAVNSSAFGLVDTSIWFIYCFLIPHQRLWGLKCSNKSPSGVFELSLISDATLAVKLSQMKETKIKKTLPSKQNRCIIKHPIEIQQLYNPALSLLYQSYETVISNCLVDFAVLDMRDDWLPGRIKSVCRSIQSGPNLL